MQIKMVCHTTQLFAFYIHDHGNKFGDKFGYFGVCWLETVVNVWN